MSGKIEYKKDWREHTKKSATMLNKGEPGVANCFLFEIDGVEIGIFKEVKGLEFTVNMVEIPEGGQNAYTHKGVGKISWNNIILRRGMTESDALFEWVTKTANARHRASSTLKKSSVDGRKTNGTIVNRNTGAITAISHTGDRLRAWSLVDCYPVKWRGPEFSIDSRSPLEEELEISHHGFTSKTF